MVIKNFHDGKKATYIYSMYTFFQSSSLKNIREIAKNADAIY